MFPFDVLLFSAIFFIHFIAISRINIPNIVITYKGKINRYEYLTNLGK